MEKIEGLRMLKTKRFAAVVIVLSIGLLCAGGVFAQAGKNGPCAEDIQKFCKDVQLGGEHIGKCLKEHENELSPGCREMIVAMMKGRGGVREACEDDASKYCKDVQHGGGGIARCLQEHESDLSPACKERVTKMTEGRRGGREACKEDVQKFCKDVQPGDGGILRCLKEHEQELSPECKNRVEKRKGTQ